MPEGTAPLATWIEELDTWRFGENFFKALHTHMPPMQAKIFGFQLKFNKKLKSNWKCL